MRSGTPQPKGIGPAAPADDGGVRSALRGKPHPVDPGNHFDRIEPYLPDFEEAALLEGEDCALLCAIALRETWAGWAPGYRPKGSYIGRGDGGHGFGLFQMDDRGPYGHLPRECPEATPFLQARWACQVLKDARRDLADFKDHPLHERAVVARYNASLKRIREALVLGHDPDHVTTGKDYGADVLRRRDWLRATYPARFPKPHGRAP
jgi:hypothetical protein